MEPRKVLIIARDFIPYHYSLGGVARVLKMSVFLSEAGFEVHILAARGEKIDFFGYEQLPPRVTVHYVVDPLQRWLNRSWKRGGRRASGSRGLPGRLTDWARAFVMEVSVPDIAVFLTGRYFRKATDLIRKTGIRNVVVSSPPHSTQIIGLRLKRRFRENICLIADFRDSWNERREVGSKRTRLFHSLSIMTENRVLEAADYILCISRPMRERIAKKCPGAARKAIVVMNGFDEAMAGPEIPRTPKGDSLSIGHFGRFINGKDGIVDPGPLFGALQRFRGKVRLHLFGFVKLDPRWKAELGDVLQIHDALPHAEAIRAMRNMNLLLFYHTRTEGAEEVVSGKLFDYMLAERPILIIGPARMEASRIVRQEGIGLVIDGLEQESIVSEITGLYRMWEEEKLPTYRIEDLAEYGRRRQFSRMLAILT